MANNRQVSGSYAHLRAHLRAQEAIVNRRPALDAIGMCSRLKRGGHSWYIEGDEENWPSQPTPGAVAEADARIKVRH